MARDMHVLIIPSWYPDAPGEANGSFFREQAIALAGRVAKVGLIYPNLRSLRRIARGEPGGIQFENDEGVLTYRLQAFNWSPRIPFGICQQWISRGMKLFEAYVAAQGMPDLIHAHAMLFAGTLGAAIKQRFRIPLVITEHSTGYAKANLSGYELQRAEQTSHAADEKLAVSRELAELLNSQFGGSPRPWQSLPNIVNQDFLTYPLEPKTRGERFKFVNVALLNKIKRHAELLQAFAAAFRSDPRVSLVIAGDGPERDALRSLVKELQLDAQVTLLGHVERDRVPALLADADAFVLSSGYETFGVVVVEALAMGVPVVSTACGGPNSIVTDEDGILVDVDDIDQLSRAMRQIRDRISHFDPPGIRARCLARYGEAAVVGRLISIYGNLPALTHAAH